MFLYFVKSQHLVKTQKKLVWVHEIEIIFVVIVKRHFLNSKESQKKKTIIIFVKCLKDLLSYFQSI